MPRINYFGGESTASSGPISYNEVTGLTQFINTNTSSAIASLVGTAPVTLNTLGEISDAIGDNSAFIDEVVLKSGSVMTGILTVPILKTASLSLNNVLVDSNSDDLNRLASVTPGTAVANKALIAGATSNISGLGAIGCTALVASGGLTAANLTLAGTAINSTGAEINRLAGASFTQADLTKLGAISASAIQLNKMTTVTASAAEINILTGATATSADLTKISGLTCSKIELNKLTGLTPSTAEINRLAGATFVTGDLTKLGSITATAAELNASAGVTLGTAAASKNLTLNASGGISGISSLSTAALTVNGTTLTSTAIANLGALDASAGAVSASRAVIVDANKSITGFADIYTERLYFYDLRARAVLGGSVAITMPIGVDLLFNDTTNIAGGMFEGLTERGRMSKNGCMMPRSYAYTDLGLANIVLSEDGSYAMESSGLNRITVANTGRFVSRINPNGVVLEPFRKMTLVNKTAVILVLAHRYFPDLTDGCLRGGFRELMPNASVTLIYDNALKAWLLEDAAQAIETHRFKLYRWTGDSVLKMFLNTQNSYRALINVSSATATTISGVSTFQNFNLSSTSGTNWAVSNTTGMTALFSQNGPNLTDVESNKLTSCIYSTNGNFDLTFSNLTQGNYYMLCVYNHVWSTTAYHRSNKIIDKFSGEEITYNSETFSTNVATNSPACIVSYTFKQTSFTSRVFNIMDVNSFWLMFGFTLCDLGASL